MELPDRINADYLPDCILIGQHYADIADRGRGRGMMREAERDSRVLDAIAVGLKDGAHGTR